MPWHLLAGRNNLPGKAGLLPRCTTLQKMARFDWWPVEIVPIRFAGLTPEIALLKCSRRTFSKDVTSDVER